MHSTTFAKARLTGKTVHNRVNPAQLSGGHDHTLRLPRRGEAVLHEEMELFNRRVLPLSPLVEFKAELRQVSHGLLKRVLVIHFNMESQLGVFAEGTGRHLKLDREVLLLATDIDEKLLDFVVDFLPLRFNAVEIILIGISLRYGSSNLEVWVLFQLARHEIVDVVGVEHEELEELAGEESLRSLSLCLPPLLCLRTVRLHERVVLICAEFDLMGWVASHTKTPIRGFIVTIPLRQ